MTSFTDILLEDVPGIILTKTGENYNILKPKVCIFAIDGEDDGSFGSEVILKLVLHFVDNYQTDFNIRYDFQSHCGGSSMTLARLVVEYLVIYNSENLPNSNFYPSA